MNIQCWAITDKGLRRDSNQDSILVDSNLQLYVVADGMGGHSGGEVASQMAVQTVKDILQKSDFNKESPQDILQKAYLEASRNIFDRAKNEQPELTGMGTTMVLALVKDNSIFVANVGDSRCYLHKVPHLWQITEDHSLLNEHLRAGFMTEQQVRHMVARNVITRSVGYERDVVPDIMQREWVEGEYYLLCSDGLSSMVSDEQICSILNQNPPDKAVHACLQKALEHGGDDNISILLLGG
ncbi:MAG: Stp1/IreP family PP2C-type Ser/Thr phosphatase [Pseudobdellovibrionaceae bacterium]